MEAEVSGACETDRLRSHGSTDDDLPEINAFEQELPTQQQCTSLSQIMQEVKKLMGIAGPLASLNYILYLKSVVSILFLGHLGGLPLAGGTLSISFTNITGYAVLSGLASGMDPVCGQAFGSGNKPKLGLTLQRMILILLTASVPIAILWLNLEPILITLGQNFQITEVAAKYCLWSLPDLAANSFLQPLKIYLKSQNLAGPMFWCSFLATVIHVPVNLAFTSWLHFDVPGVAVAAVVTNYATIIFLLVYLYFSGVLHETWTPWSRSSLREWRPLLNLAVPSCLSVCLEWWWYEILILLAGRLPNPHVTVATSGIIIQTTALMYALPHALGSAASTRVGRELGAGRPSHAKTASFVALASAEAVAVASLLWSIALRREWGGFFSRDEEVLALTAAVMPLVGVCELGNCLQTVGVGVLRGSGRVVVGARINLGAFYVVGMPVAVGLAFWAGAGFVGLWWGLFAAQGACAGLVVWVVYGTDWEGEARKAREEVGVEVTNLTVLKTSHMIVPSDYELVNSPD